MGFWCVLELLFGVKSTRLAPSRNLHTLSMRAFIFRHDFSISSRTFPMGCILLYTEEQSLTRRKKQGSRTLCKLLMCPWATIREWRVPGLRLLEIYIHFPWGHLFSDMISRFPLVLFSWVAFCFTQKSRVKHAEKNKAAELCVGFLWVKKGTLRPGDKIMTLGLHFHLDAREEAIL